MTDDRSDEDELASEDPFDRLGPDANREGDPFERLGDDAGDHANAPEQATADGHPHDEDRTDGNAPWSSTTTDATPTNAANPDATTGRSTSAPSMDDAADPFADVVTPDGSPFDGGSSAFDRVDSGSADPDAVWEAITGEDDTVDDVSTSDDGRYAEVSKHTFCERCEHFSRPPEVACSHHTAEIIEFLDVETVRLLNCPIVAERRKLEREG